MLFPRALFLNLMSPIVMMEHKGTNEEEEERVTVMTVTKMITGIAVLMKESDLQMVEVPLELLPEGCRYVGAKLTWRMRGNVEREFVESAQFMQLQRRIREMFSRRIEFDVKLQYIKMDGDSCKVSFVWTPLKQLLTPFQLISLDVYCGDVLLRIGVNADGGIHSVLDAEESELVISGLEVTQAYVFKFVARTNTGNFEGGDIQGEGVGGRT